MQEVTFRKTILPTLIALTILVLFNLGLYFRLSAESVTETIAFPYQNTFETDEILQYPSFGGDWDIRDESLVQISTTGFDLGILIPLDIQTEQAYRYSVDMRYLGGTMGGGVIFNSQNGRNRQQSHMARFNIDDNRLWIIYGYFGDDSNFRGQGSVPLEIDPENVDWQRLGVIVGQDSYGVLLNDTLIVDEVPLQYQGGAIGLNTSASQVAFDNLVVEAWDESTPEIIVETTPEIVTELPTEVVSNTLDDTSILFDDFSASGGGPSLWLPFSGAWEFVNGAFVQSQLEGFDLGAGYNQAFGDVTVTTTFRHLEGQGAGILFNMQTPDSQWNAHMVRYVHDDEFLFWGYFDDEGNFNGQGSVPILAPSNDSHTLTVINNGTTYSIVLDEQMLAPNIPVVVTGDYVGLVTAQSQVAFDDFNVSGNGEILVPEVEATEETSIQSLNLNIVTGDWEFGDTIIQSATETVDYIAGTGIAAETFSVSVTIALPDDLDDAGAGLVFHMSGRDDIANGQMIRFGSGGTEIFWGIYDDDATFEGQGGAPLELDWTEPHRLTLDVSADTYDVLIDGEILITDLPVYNPFGWIGLVSYRGEVRFSDFALSIGQ